jgi:arginyl-tRNA synthetase
MMLIYSLKKRLLEQIEMSIPAFSGEVPGSQTAIKKANLSSISLGEPKNKSFGDLTTNAAMVLAPVFKKNPMQIAEIIAKDIIEKWQEATEISVAAPGFINFTIAPAYLQKAIQAVALGRSDFGKNTNGKGTKIQVEFVSANPTGSLHIGHGRWAALGDSLSNIFDANGYDVCREYYVNDFGSQIAKFAQCAASLYLKAFNREMPYPEDGYPEEFVKTVAEQIVTENGDLYLTGLAGNTEESIAAGIAAIGRRGVEIMVERIKSTLSSMGVEFDVWFYEGSLYENNNFENTVKKLQADGAIYEKDNALWFKASKYGDEKDRVIVRSGGEPTYFASDIMYLLNKVARGFNRLIYILGADHHGYIKRLHAIGRAAGFNDENIEVIIGQLVHLVENGQAVKMSKRKGRVYMLDDLLEEVGSDAVRYFFTANSFDTPMEFDLDLAKQKSNQNPVYYVQYAHARIANVMEKVRSLYSSGELQFEKDSLVLPAGWAKPAIETVGENNFSGINEEYGFSVQGKVNHNYSLMEFEKDFDFLLSKNRFDCIRLKNEDEMGLAKILLLYPDIVSDACINEAPYMINQYLYRLAAQFHYFYKHHRIIDEDRLNTGRFKLILLVRVVLSNAMKLLKIGTPVKM